MFGDEDKPEIGIVELGKLYPATKEATGTVFAVLFIVFRVVVWPILSYTFWVDCLTVLYQDTLHSSFCVYVFLASNVFLTTLQFVWLGEIIGAARKMLTQKYQKGETKRAAIKLAMARGSLAPAISPKLTAVADPEPIPSLSKSVESAPAASGYRGTGRVMRSRK